MPKFAEKRVMIDCQVELEVSDKLFRRICDNKAALTEFVLNNAFRNNSRTVIGAHLFKIESKGTNHEPSNR